MILASCYTLGIQRFDLRGRNEGSYHLGGTVSHAVPDFPGRSIAAATLEGELAVMNSGGNVRWRTTLARPVTRAGDRPPGPVRRLRPRHRRDRPARPLRRCAGANPGASVEASRGGRDVGLRRPHLERRRAHAQLGRPRGRERPAGGDRRPRRGRGPPGDRRVHQPAPAPVFDTDGQKRGQAPDLTGVGRQLRTAPGWLAAATDRQILLYDLKHNTPRRLDVSLVELTHLAIRPDDFGLALVQERDRIGRLTVAGRWVWKQELRSPVEDLAIGPYGFVAVTTHGGEFLVFDPAGRVHRRIHVRRDRSAPADRGSRRLASAGRLGHPGPSRPAPARPRPARAGPLGAPDPLGGLGPLSDPAVRRGDVRRWPCPGLHRLGRARLAIDLVGRRQRRLLQRPGRHPAPHQPAGRPSDLLVARRPRPLAGRRRSTARAAGLRLPGRRRHARAFARLVPGRVEPAIVTMSPPAIGIDDVDLRSMRHGNAACSLQASRSIAWLVGRDRRGYN